MDQAGVSAKMISGCVFIEFQTFEVSPQSGSMTENHGRSWVAIVPRTPEAPCPINSTKSAAWRAPAIDAPCEAQKTGDSSHDAIVGNIQIFRFVAKGSLCGGRSVAPVAEVTMEVSVLVNTTVVIPDRPANRAATLWIPIPEEATMMRP